LLVTGQAGAGDPTRDPVTARAEWRSGWRRGIAEVLYRTGALNLLKKFSRRFEWQGSVRRISSLRQVKHSRFLILCYHRVGTEGIPFYSTQSPDLFEAQMRFLRKHYRIVSLNELLRELGDPGRQDPAVAVTFDDGYRDVYNYAFPILRRYHIPATVYLTAGCIESGEVAWYDRIFLALQVCPRQVLEADFGESRRFVLNSRESRLQAATQIVSLLRKTPDTLRKQICRSLEAEIILPNSELADRMLTWDQVREMQSAGASFGAHTMTHPVVSRLSREDLEFELRESKRPIEDRLQTGVTDFAYPFGQPSDYGNVAPAIVSRCGFRSAVTTVPGVSVPGTDLYRLGRAQVSDESSIGMLAFRLGRFFLLSQGTPTDGGGQVASMRQAEQSTELPT